MDSRAGLSRNVNSLLMELSFSCFWRSQLIRYWVKTGVGLIIGNFNENTYVINERMERQVRLQDRRWVKSEKYWVKN